MSTAHTHKIPEWKVQEVENLSELLNKYNIIGLIKIESIGARQLQTIRDKLRGKAVIKMARNNLMKLALKKVQKKNIEKLSDFIKGPVAFIVTNDSIFKLVKFLRENKTYGPIKEGQVANADIWVPEGNTGFPPGPIITELAALKIPARTKSGTIHITEDTLVARKGEIVSGALAQMLTRLGIEPREIELKIIAAYENGDIITEEALSINLDEFIDMLALAHQEAFNLSVYVAYPTKENIQTLISKAHTEARNLALNAGVITPELIGDFLAKANAEAYALAIIIAQKDPNAIPEDVLGAISTQPAQTTETKEEKEEEQEEEEDEGPAGLAGLFG